MSAFLEIASNTLEDYLESLSTVILIKKMMEAGLPVDPSWTIHQDVGHQFLRIIFGEQLKYQENHQTGGMIFYILKPITRTGVRKMKALIESLEFTDEWSTCRFEVSQKGMAFEFDTSYVKLHFMFNDFIQVAELFKTLPDRKGGVSDTGQRRKKNHNHQAG